MTSRWLLVPTNWLTRATNIISLIKTLWRSGVLPTIVIGAVTWPLFVKFARISNLHLSYSVLSVMINGTFLPRDRAAVSISCRIWMDWSGLWYILFHEGKMWWAPALAFGNGFNSPHCEVPLLWAGRSPASYIPLYGFFDLLISWLPFASNTIPETLCVLVRCVIVSEVRCIR